MAKKIIKKIVDCTKCDFSGDILYAGGYGKDGCSFYCHDLKQFFENIPCIGEDENENYIYEIPSACKLQDINALDPAGIERAAELLYYQSCKKNPVKKFEDPEEGFRDFWRARAKEVIRAYLGTEASDDAKKIS